MNDKIRKLQQAKQYSLVSKIFLNCSIFVNGSTDPPRNEINRLVCIHGGQFDSYQTSRTTHFLCDFFPNAKLKELRKRRQSSKLSYVTTQWLLDSIAKGQRLLEGEYLPRGLIGQCGRSMAQYFAPQLTAVVRPDSVDLLVDVEEEVVTNRTSSEPEVGSDSMPSDPPPLHTTASLPLHPTSTSSLRLSVSLPSETCLSNAQASSSHHSFSSPLSLPPWAAERPPSEASRGAAGDPNFLNSYFETSRLHFLGSWKARLPTLLSTIQRERELWQTEQLTQLSLPFPIGLSFPLFSASLTAPRPSPRFPRDDLYSNGHPH
jgi:DNA repair protein REV1